LSKSLPDSRVGLCGLSSSFQKIKASGKRVLFMPMESSKTFHSCADQQNAAVGAL
jgi:hypothetical protein